MRIEKLFLLGLCLLLLGAKTPAQQSSAATSRVTPATQLKRTVSFITVAYVKNGKDWEAKGTCFFVGVVDKRFTDDRAFVYLVTNRHVAEPGSDDGAHYPVRNVRIRLNTRDNSGAPASVEGLLPLGGAVRWYFPSDESVDLAVLPFAPDTSKFDYQAIPLTFFATKDVVESKQIAEGDRVLFTGFFYSFPGVVRMEPIVREGILAMLPDEEMETTLHRRGHVYLADVHAFGGNSGAPLFVDIGGVRNGAITVGGFPFLLLGVVSGYYAEDQDFKLTVTTTLSGKVPENSGISTVVPADELKALLESPALQAQRDAQFAGGSK